MPEKGTEGRKGLEVDIITEWGEADFITSLQIALDHGWTMTDQFAMCHDPNDDTTFFSQVVTWQHSGYNRDNLEGSGDEIGPNIE